MVVSTSGEQTPQESLDTVPLHLTAGNRVMWLHCKGFWEGEHFSFPAIKKEEKGGLMVAFGWCNTV